MRDLKKAMHRCYEVRLVEDWFRGISAQRTHQCGYYRNENELKLMMAFRVLQEDGVCCRKLDCADLTRLANIIRSEPKEAAPEIRPRDEKQ